MTFPLVGSIKRLGGGAGPVNPCGTGASYPAGWQFLHTEISGGLGSWGNMLKVSGYNNFAVEAENGTDGTESVCYLNGEVDKSALNTFFSVDADINISYDQFALNDLSEPSQAQRLYVKADNDLIQGGIERNTLINPLSGALASLKNDDARTICLVIDYPDVPLVNKFFGPLSFPSNIGSDTWVWSGNNISLIMRMNGTQGYFYNGLRSAGTKLIIWTYDGRQPISKDGMEMYWNGTIQVPSGNYNTGPPSQQTLSTLIMGFNTASSDGFVKELDIFNFAFDASEVAAAKAIYEQKYTFS